ncbi:hypothetical protein G6F57_019015 [Rhizopus arrhizus]|nr:hypothetical protein G6F57_019015 [Rhizopus arrhizus]
MPLEWEELVTQLDTHMPREAWAQTLVGIGMLILTALFVQWVVARVVLLLAHRVLVLSGRPEHEISETCDGYAAYLRKPAEPEEVLKTIRRLMTAPARQPLPVSAVSPSAAAGLETARRPAAGNRHGAASVRTQRADAGAGGPELDAGTDPGLHLPIRRFDAQPRRGAGVVRRVSRPARGPEGRAGLQHRANARTADRPRHRTRLHPSE